MYTTVVTVINIAQVSERQSTWNKLKSASMLWNLQSLQCILCIRLYIGSFANQTTLQPKQWS